MDIQEFKEKIIKDILGINDDFNRIFIFIDFSNVNKWFEKDRQDWNNRQLKENEILNIDVEKLKIFTDTIGEKTKIYYGENPLILGSCKFTDLLRILFGKKNVITKDVQKIKHYIDHDKEHGLENEKTDNSGKIFIEIKKCNFDVEIAVDAIKMMNYYDTFCIFSGDSDFVYLNKFLKEKNKKIIIVKGGYITTELRKTADLVINAQQIKKDIARVEIKKTKT